MLRIVASSLTGWRGTAEKPRRNILRVLPRPTGQRHRKGGNTMTIQETFEQILLREGRFFYIPQATYEKFKTWRHPRVKFSTVWDERWEKCQFRSRLGDPLGGRRSLPFPPHLTAADIFRELVDSIGLRFPKEDGEIDWCCDAYLELSDKSVAQVLGCSVDFYDQRHPDGRGVREVADDEGILFYLWKHYPSQQVTRCRRRVEDRIRKNPVDAVETAEFLEILKE